MTDQREPEAATRRVVIVGGGITGLATAYYLRRAVRPRDRIEVVVLEASARAGGKLRTIRQDGFVVEAGPDSFLTSKPAALVMCRDLGLAGELIPQRLPTGAYVLRRGRLIAIPSGMRLVHPVRPWRFLRSPLLSVSGRLRALAHPFVRPRRETGDESVGSYVQRRYGAEMLRILGEPLLAGIHLADPWQLSLAATFPALHSPPPQRPGAGPIPHAQELAHLLGSPFASLAGGMAQLGDALIEALGSSLSTNTTVNAIIPADGAYRLGLQGPPGLSGHFELPAAAVVVTTPVAAAERLVREVNPSLAKLLGAAQTTSSAIVSLGYRSAGTTLPTAGSGFLVPRDEGSQLLACTWSSNKFDGRAPEGGILVRGFLGGWRDPNILEREDDELLKLVQRELAQLIGGVFARGEPAVSHVARWADGTPLYRVGHREWLAKITAACKATPGLWLAGAPYDGVGIPDCIRQGRMTASAVARYLE